MPIWLRTHTFNKIKDHYEKRNEAVKNQKLGNKNTKTLVDSTGQVNKGEFKQASQPYKKSSYK